MGVTKRVAYKMEYFIKHPSVGIIQIRCSGIVSAQLSSGTPCVSIPETNQNPRKSILHAILFSKSTVSPPSLSLIQHFQLPAS